MAQVRKFTHKQLLKLQGKFLSSGFQEVCADHAQTQHDLLKEIMGDISSSKQQDIYFRVFLLVKT